MTALLSSVRLGPGLAVGLALLLGAPSAEAQLFGGNGLFGRKSNAPRQLTEEEIGVPIPKTGRVQAVKGQEVRFEIEAGSKAAGAAVEFLIRTMPTAGRIVSLVENPNARNRAIVTYYASPESSAESDVFGFAVRYRGGRYSSEMRFDIDLVDVKAEVQATPKAEFGEVMVGEEAVVEVTVRNVGTGGFDRQIYLSPPWRIVEPAGGRLLIGPNQAQVVKVGFRPTLVGETRYFLSFGRTKGATTEMTGSGTPSFSLPESEVQLVLDPKSGVRSGELQVVNHREKPMRLAIQASSRIRSGLPEMILVPPGEPYPIQVRLIATDTAPFDGMLQLSQPSGLSLAARLVSPVVPGKLVVDVPNSLADDVMNFGRVAAGRSFERGFRLQNTGGVAVPLEFHVPDPFRLLTDPGPELEPGSSVNIAVGVYPASNSKGPVDVTMNVLGLEQSLPIRLLANVIPGAPSPGKGGEKKSAPVLEQIGPVRLGSGKTKSVAKKEKNPSLPPESSLPPAVPPSDGFNEPKEGEVIPGFETIPLLVREHNVELRSPEDLSVVAASDSGLTIGWTAPPDSQLSRFEVEVAGLGTEIETGMPASVWYPYERVKFDRVDRLVKARIQGLAPDSTYHFRVFTVDENGRSSSPSEIMEASTELPMDWTWIYAGLLLGFLVLLGYGVWKVIMNRRPEVYQARYVDS